MPIDAGVEIALIVTFGTFAGGLGTAISQTLMSRMTAKDRQRERQEDWGRQDAVAERAAEAARLLLEQQKIDSAKAHEVADRLVESNKKFAHDAAAANEALLESNSEIKGGLAVVHGLVNSALTTEKQAVYDGLIRELSLIQKMVTMNHDAGYAIKEETLNDIEMLQAKISDLKVQLVDRNKEAMLLERKKREAIEEGDKDHRRREEDLGR